MIKNSILQVIEFISLSLILANYEQIIIFFSITIWKRIYPSNKSRIVELTESEAKQYNNLLLRSFLLMIPGTIVFGFISYKLFIIVINRYFSIIGYEYVIMETKAILGFASLMLGLYLNIPFVQLVNRIVHREKYFLFENYYDQKMGSDNRKVGKIVSIVYGVIVSIPIFLFLITYVGIKYDAIVIRNLANITGKTCQYSEISDIQIQINDNTSANNEKFIIICRNGFEWKSEPFDDNSTYEYQKEIDIISKRSNKQIIVIHVS